MNNNLFKRISPSATTEVKKEKFQQLYFFDNKIETIKWNEGVYLFKPFNFPLPSAYTWGFVAKYFYLQGAGYFNLTDAQVQRIETLRRRIWKEQPQICKSKSNPMGLDLQPKARVFFQAAQFKFENNIINWDPVCKVVWLPYSFYNTQAGNTLQDLRIKTNFADQLQHPNLFNVTDDNGNWIAGETLRVEVRGQNDRREYSIRPESPVLVPEYVMNTAINVDEHLTFATDDQLNVCIESKLTSVSPEINQKYKL
jgi:hypothetical protein